jgi:hypothetical protein
MAEQEMRAAMEAAVPEPPRMPGRGPEARTRARRDRRRRWATAGAVVAAAAVAVPVVRAAGTRHDATLPGSFPGQGLAACRKLDGHLGLGSPLDARSVDGATAARWLRQTTGDPVGGAPIDPADVAAARVVTVCVMARRTVYSVVVMTPGHVPVVDAKGDYQSLGDLMQPLDALWKGGTATTDAAFACPGRSTQPANDVSTSLPTGATAARICYDGDNLYQPRQVLTSRVDDLVRAIDDSSLYYVAPHIACGGTPMSYDYTVVFDYPSGTRTVSEETCRGLAIGPYTREGPAGALDKTFLSMLQRQESAEAPARAPDCPDPSTDKPEGTGDVRHVVAARYCASGSTGPGHILTHAQLSVLHQWGDSLMPGSTAIEGRCDRPVAGWPHVALADAWGNRFTMTVECQHRLFPVVRSVGGRAGVTYPTGLDDRTLDHLLRHLAARS